MEQIILPVSAVCSPPFAHCHLSLPPYPTYLTPSPGDLRASTSRRTRSSTRPAGTRPPTALSVHGYHCVVDHKPPVGATGEPYNAAVRAGGARGNGFAVRGLLRGTSSTLLFLLSLPSTHAWPLCCQSSSLFCCVQSTPFIRCPSPWRAASSAVTLGIGHDVLRRL